MEIEDLYALLPDFQCTAGCIECCRSFGVPSRTKVEDAKIKKFLQEHRMEVRPAEGNTCPYVSAAGCTIYPVRPLICRLYGTSPNYLCKMGVKPVRLLHPDEEADIFHLYRKYFF